MRHNVDGRKFGRNTSHRKAMFRNLANSVVDQEQVVTTLHKAKEVRRVVDRLITLGKTDSQHARRMAFSKTRDAKVVTKLFADLAQRYQSRAGGYTRVVKISDRRAGDAAEMAVLELVDRPAIDRKRKAKVAESTETAKEGGEVAAEAAANTFNRFKKLFSGTKRTKKQSS